MSIGFSCHVQQFTRFSSVSLSPGQGHTSGWMVQIDELIQNAVISTGVISTNLFQMQSTNHITLLQTFTYILPPPPKELARSPEEANGHMLMDKDLRSLVIRRTLWINKAKCLRVCSPFLKPSTSWIHRTDVTHILGRTLFVLRFTNQTETHISPLSSVPNHYAIHLVQGITTNEGQWTA